MSEVAILVSMLTFGIGFLVGAKLGSRRMRLYAERLVAARSIALTVAARSLVPYRPDPTANPFSMEFGRGPRRNNGSELVLAAADLLKRTSGDPDLSPEWERLDDAVRSHQGRSS